MRYNKCLIDREMHSVAAVGYRVRVSGSTDLCVSADGPWGGGRCGRTFRSRRNPWRTRPRFARDAGTEPAERSPPPSPSHPQHLEHTQRQDKGGRQIEGVLSATSNQPTTHHNTTRFFFHSYSSVSHCPYIFQMCERHTKSSNRPCYFPPWQNADNS